MSEERPPSDDAARDDAAQERTTGPTSTGGPTGPTSPTGPTGRADTPRPGRDEDPEPPRATDADAWATACAEDLEAEQARRRARYGPPPGSAAEELRKFVDTVADKLSSFRSPLLGALAGPAAEQLVRQAVRQARAAVEPVVERNPGVFDHLAAAGGELLAAYRSAVEAQEHRWTSRASGADDLRDDRTGGGRRDGREDGSRGGREDGSQGGPQAGPKGFGDRRDPGEGTGGGERIDVD
ncbi:DUF5304 domain-containing protein [Streptomyces sp. NPDC058319]|uniref:DUF5304 domain-containing protein n=1 Tax=unclassified Streptomyces TaxID=2593676 RepID=UPI0036E3B7DD